MISSSSSDRQVQEIQKPHDTTHVMSRIVNNTFISLLGQATTWSSTLLLTIAYGRFLGDLRFGELYFAFTFCALIGIPIELGFNQQIIRDVAREPARALRHLSNTLLIKLAIWIVLYIALLSASRLLGYGSEQRVLIAIFGVTLLSSALATTFASMHYAAHNVVFPVIGTVLEKGTSALVGIIVLWSGAGVVSMAFVLLLGSLLSLSWQAIWFYRRVGIGFSFDSTLIRHLVRGSIPFIAYGALGVLYYRLDTVLLSLMTSTTVVGWYGAAYRLFDTLTFLPALIIGQILYPAFSNWSTASPMSLKSAIDKTLTFLLVCGIPLAVVTIVAAPELIHLLYHQRSFDHAVPVLQALAPGLVLLYVNAVLGAAVISMHRERKMTLMAAIALVFNVGLNLILIPLYRHVGAAAVTSLTELLLFGLTVGIAMPRDLLPRRGLLTAAKAIGAGLIMAAVLWLLDGFTIFVAVPVAFCAYVAALAALRVVPREDVMGLLAAIGRKRGKQPPIGGPDVSQAQG